MQVINSYKSGFTLIEMSIVLVVIGLIVGGILTGQDLMNTATIRAQISQIEKYQTAVRTFQGKYGYLPGDIPDPYASNFGFQARGLYPGEGDGNGILLGNCSNSLGSTGSAFSEACGELAVFWEDLSTASLIDTTIYGYDTKGNNYPSNQGTTGIGYVSLNTIPGIKDWLPIAKIGTNNFIYLYSLGGINYFTVSSVTKINTTIESTANPGLTVQQAYIIDSKIDDGLPQSGSVNACYVNHNVANKVAVWSAGSNLQGAPGGSGCNPTTAATNYLNTNCYDNADATGNGVNGTAQQYSVRQNGNIANCALSFKFQ